MVALTAAIRASSVVFSAAVVLRLFRLYNARARVMRLAIAGLRSQRSGFGIKPQDERSDSWGSNSLGMRIAARLCPAPFRDPHAALAYNALGGAVSAKRGSVKTYKTQPSWAPTPTSFSVNRT